MKPDIKPSWLAMSIPRLERHLTAKKYPTDLLQDTVRRVAKAKEQLRRQRIKTTKAYQLWADVLRAARIEIAGVRTMKCQTAALIKSADGVLQPDAKYKALSVYEDVLIATIEKLRKVQKADEYTPSQFVQYIHKETGRLIPNDGEHWSDYVGASTKLKIEVLFRDLPDPTRGKRKTPFERRISKEEHAVSRAHLVGQLEKAQVELEERLAMPSTSAGKQALDELEQDLQRANYVLSTLKHTSPLPARWQGLLNM
jgi:hypothetical protein